MIRKLKRACGIRFSTKALVRNHGVYLRQAVRRFRSLGDLLGELADERRVAIVQIGANDGDDAVGDLIRNRPGRVVNALLIEPQPAAFDRLVRRMGGCGAVVCLNVAIDRQAGERTLYSVRQPDRERLGDGIASFDRRHVENEIRHTTKTDFGREAATLMATETVRTATLEEAAAAAGIGRPDVLMVDTEGFDTEIVRMALEAGWLPAVIQYEHKHLSRDDRRELSEALSRRGYCLWADHADVWGCRAAARGNKALRDKAGRRRLRGRESDARPDAACATRPSRFKSPTSGVAGK